MSHFVHIVSFDEFEPAEVLARRLVEKGFDASANSESAEQLLKLYNPHPRAHCHVVVPGEQADAALQRLKELEVKEPILRGAIRCPDCGSTQIEYPQFSRKTIIGALPSVAAAVGIVDRQFYCSACQFTWLPPEDPSGEVAPGKDLLR